MRNWNKLCMHIYMSSSPEKKSKTQHLPSSSSLSAPPPSPASSLSLSVLLPPPPPPSPQSPPPPSSSSSSAPPRTPTSSSSSAPPRTPASSSAPHLPPSSSSLYSRASPELRPDLSGLGPLPKAPDDTEFFTEAINDQFVADITSIPPHTALDGLKFYTLSGLLERLDSFRVGTRNIESNKYYLHMKKLNKNILIQFLASSICTGIGEYYGQISVENAIKKKDYDIVVIADPSIMEVDVRDDSQASQASQAFQDSQAFQNTEDFSQLGSSEIQAVQVFNKEVASSPARSLKDFTRGKVAPYLELERPLRSDTALWEPPIPTDTPDNNKILNDKFKSILGFMVVQKDECPMISGAYSVNLICAKESAPKGIGALLMGLYLETILKRPEITQIALLELAGGYLRIPALCLYLKFGFRHEPRMLHPRCFTSAGNMPMILDLKDPKITRELILDIASGVNKTGFKLPLCKMTPKNQNIISSLLEYSRLFNYAMNQQITMDDFIDRCSRQTNLVTVYKHILAKYRGEPVDNINDYINGIILKLEKNDQTVKTDPLIQALGGVDGGNPKRIKRTRTKRISRKKSRTMKHKK